jgi:hypothetical protein
MKTEQVVDLVDKLIAERLRLHMVQTSKSIGANLDKRALTVDMEKIIAAIKANLTEALIA